MKFETIETIPDLWCELIKDFVNVDVHITINAVDGSFSHDWHPGAIEERVDCDVENIYYSFQWKGKAVLFDPDSGHNPIFLEDYEREYFEDQLVGVTEVALQDATEAFRHPEDYAYVD